MSPTPTVTRLAQQMSENATLVNQVLTRQRAQSSSQQVRPIQEMVDSMEQIGKRNRGQKRSPTPNPASISTIDSEEVNSSPTSNPASTERREPLALQIWNELFGEDEFNKLAEQSDYIQVRVAGLLEEEQMERLANGTTEEGGFQSAART